MSCNAVVLGYQSAAAVTPHDSTLIPVTRGLYVGGTGAIKVQMEDGTTPTFAAVPVGVFPLQVKQVFATGTAATNIVALY